MALISKVTIPSFPGIPGSGSGLVWTGTAKSEKKVGTSKADMLFGMQGNDTLDGKAGNDTLDGSAGNDKLLGGGGKDALTMMGADTLTGGADGDFFILLGIKYNMRLGSANTSVITDFKAKGADHDVLELGGMFKFKWADRDKDTNDGFAMTQKGKDVHVYTKDPGGNIQKIILKNVKLADLTPENVKIIKPPPGVKAADPIGDDAGGAGNDRLRGDADDNRILGHGGDDTLRGAGGDDTLDGGAGSDLLLGGRGDDRLLVSGGDTALGGHGADTFVLVDQDAGVARIRDFETGTDRIDLSGFDLDWSGRDKGLEDGFELRQVAGGTEIRVVDGDGDLVTLMLQGVKPGQLSADDFLF
ncbi:M10 family metallopeptidase C-terminal domain-containing protein [Gemmobacter serpentinus]|uniref:M10 family metallopeptidase C-terminal domain-containing protein n=1 Tax=Gemmobacter serpentinus TaxID=2652247 RepID=UPI00124D80FC|nr:hypothetical protein [Gemmobacter serpentinus]